MKNTVVVGAQWGDEGKAKITDLLAKQADVIIRYQGGCNAGHTVVANGKTYKFHLIPSGILYDDKMCVIGAGTVIHPAVLMDEINDLIAKGIDTQALKISHLAHLTMPYHIDLDGADEAKLGKNKIGTTKRGIGPTYTDKMARIGFRIEDLYDEELLDEKINKILPIKNQQLEQNYGLKPYSKEEIKEFCSKYAELLKPYVDFELLDKLHDDYKAGKTILFEGAQGALLDIDFGTYPYVTSSNPVAGGAFTGTGLGATVVEEIIGVFKAYITRVGEGPFVTELEDEEGAKIQEIGQEFGVTTGRKRRCGWFDVPLAKYSAQINGMTGIALTKLDVFDGFEKIKLCTAYIDKRNGETYTSYQTNINTHKYLEPVYQVFEGWCEDTTKAKTFEDLPLNAKIYLKELETLVRTPIKIISVGPDREQTIFNTCLASV
ncbi:MAG: adenylosuccinate synthase [Candidatus Gastranaerophilales bacterium]|nr:adenylosuccinate synthase [Candidatus Gastranaerophilales bacterium]